MFIDKSIPIIINREEFLINQNEFWYFNKLLEKVDEYYNFPSNSEQSIMLKIPGTGKFKIVDRITFEDISLQVKEKISDYIEERQ